MPIPDYQSIMLPLLQLAADSANHSLAEAANSLADEFGLSPAERSELLGSGVQPKFANRVSWASTYLKKAGLLESGGRGSFRITDRGRGVLRNPPERITPRWLSRYPEFVQFRTRPQRDGEPDVSSDEATPEERLEASYRELRGALAQELLQRVKRSSPRFFETLVVDLLVAMGYGGSRQDAGQAVGQSGDDGIDGVIKEDRLGLDVVYVQAKRWDRTVGRPDVQAFAGSLEGQRARKGVMITTSQFSPDARDYVGRIEKKIVLLDGAELAELMIEHGIGVAETVRYSIRKLDLDYFGEEAS